MKSTTLIAALALSIPALGAHAQSPAVTEGPTAAPAPKKLRVGAKLGLSSASLFGDDVDDDFDSRSGLAVGGFLTYELVPKLFFQPELLYTQKGASISVNDVTVTVELNYIEIPLLMRLNFSSPTSGGHLVFGGYLAFTETARAVAEFDGDEQSEDIEDIRSNDFGLMAGAGYSWPLANGAAVTLEGRLGVGMTTLPEMDDDDVRNMAFNLLVGYWF